MSETVVETIKRTINGINGIRTGMEYVGLNTDNVDIDEYKNEIISLKSKLDAGENAEKEVIALQDENTELSSNVTKLTNENNELNFWVNNLTNTNENLNTQISNDNTNFNNIYDAIVNKGQVIDKDNRDEYSNAIDNIQTYSDEDREKIAELTEKNATLESNNESLTSKVSDLVDKNNSLNDSKSSLENTIEINNSYFDSIYEAIVNKGQSPIKDDRSTYAGEIDNINIGDNSEKITELSNKNNELQTENNRLSSENEKLISEKSSLESNNNELSLEISDNNNNFSNIYNAIVSKGQSPVESDRSTYASAIENIKSDDNTNIEINDASYLFYNNARSVDTFLKYVKNCTNWQNAFYKSVFSAGKSYTLDFTGLTSRQPFEEAISSCTLDKDGVAVISIKLDKGLGSISYIFNGSGSENRRFSVNIEDSSEITDDAIYINGTFANVYLDSIDLSKIKKIKELQTTFSGAVLKNTSGLSTLNTGSCTIFTEMFKRFNNGAYSQYDKTVDISSWDMSNAQNVLAMIAESNTQFVLPESLNLGDTDCKWFANRNTGIKNIQVELNDTNKYQNELDYLFCNCSNLEKITSNDKWIFKRNCEYLFTGCSKLTKIPKIERHIIGGNHDSLCYTFCDCSSLEEVDIDIVYDNPNGYHNMYAKYTFSGCSSLKYIKGNLDLSGLYNYDAMFSNCKSLVSIETSGSFGGYISSNQTLDLSASSVFDINGFINSLAENNSGYTKTIKVNSSVYSNITDETSSMADTKKYTIASA